MAKTFLGGGSAVYVTGGQQTSHTTASAYQLSPFATGYVIILSL